MEKYVSYEIARKLKTCNFHSPCSCCYEWTSGELMWNRTEKSLEQVSPDCWEFKFFLAASDILCEEDVPDWLSVYINHICERDEYDYICDNKEKLICIDWNMDIRPALLAHECGDTWWETDNPEIWKISLEMFLPNDTLREAGAERLETRHKAITAKLISLDDPDTDSDDDWDWKEYREVVSAPTWTEVRDWFEEEHGWSLCIIKTEEDFWEGTIFEYKTIRAEGPSYHECLQKLVDLALDLLIINKF